MMIICAYVAFWSQENLGAFCAAMRKSGPVAKGKVAFASYILLQAGEPHVAFISCPSFAFFVLGFLTGSAFILYILLG